MHNFINRNRKFFDKIPGFRNRNKVVMILASLYYLLSLFSIISSVSFLQKIGAFLVMMSIAFLLAFTIDLIKKHNIFLDAIKNSNQNRKLVNNNLLLILLSVFTFFFGGAFLGAGTPKTDSLQVSKIESEKISTAPTEQIKSSIPTATVNNTKSSIPTATVNNTKSSIPTATVNDAKPSNFTVTSIINSSDVNNTSTADSSTIIESSLSTSTITSVPKVLNTEESKLETIVPTNEPTIEPTVKPEPESFPTAKITVGNEVFEVSYIGNSNSNKFHISTCREVKKMKPNNVVKLSSRDKAINNGYIPCKICNP